ncbi:DUF334 domain-containing protein [Staphylococcus epidermidis]|nr:DUF334 domain-containing protein [Staphylococcus epidermidis]
MAKQSHTSLNANKWVRGRTLGSDYEKGRLMMSMKDIKNNKENPTMQTDSRSTGMPSSNTQSNLNNEEIERAQRQNKLIVKYLAEIEEPENERENKKQSHQN